MGNFIKKRAIKLPVAVLVCAMLVIGGGLAYKAVALSGINITTPTEGVNWSGTKEITWGGDCATYPNVNIYYSTDGFAISSTKINTSGVISCSAGTYSWDTSTVDDGNQYQVKVRDSSDPDVFDTSGVFVIDNTAPAIQTNTLTSPNGGEFWAGGSPQDITWDSSDITDANLKTSPITLEYFNGAAWQTIATNEVNDGSYAWAVPNINSATVKVKIIATDLAGNTASDESDAVFVIDSINPTATVTTSVNPIKIGALTQTVTVTYNESMAITTTPVIIIGSNWGTQTTGVWSTVGSITNNTYTTTLTHNGTAEEITNAVATVATASGATDLAGNSDIGDSSDVFVIDTKVPSVSTATANPDPAKAGTVTITVVFDENMDTVTSPTVQITGITGSPITVTQSSYANKTWIGIFTLADNNEKTTATISVTGAKDAAGNVMADNASAGTFVVDTVDPTVSLIAVDTNPIYDGDLIQKVVVIYNESMNTGTTPTITLTGSNWGTQVTGVWSQTNVANDTYTTTLTHNGTAEEIANAVATVATASGATDLAGNSDIGNSSAVFNIDTKNPTVDLSDDHADNIVRDADTVIITATFTEANGIDENPAPKITIGNVVTGAAMTKVDGTNLKWTYTWNVPADNNSTVNVSITATDNAGNPNEAATGETRYTIDNTAPTINVVLDDGDGYVNIVETGAGVNIIITTIGVEDGQTVTCNVKDGTNTVGPLTKTVSSNAVTIASGALTSLNDGTITATCDVSDIAGNLAVQGSDTSVKDVVNPTAPTAITYTSIYGIVVVDKVNTTNTNFTGGATITVGKATGGYAELLIGGVSFTTSIKDESIADADTAVIFDAGLSSNSAVQTQIAAGNQTLSVKLCDVAGNCTTSTDTKSITADYTVPTINSVALGNDEYVNAAEAGTGVNIIVNTTGVENGQTVTCGITDTSTTISSLTGVITNNTVTIASGALTSLNDGTITATCDVSDVAGNPAVQGSDTSTKDIINPTGSATSPDYSTSLTFNVSYTASDTNGIKHVELYYTTDNGTNWAKHTGTYTASPISFTASADGTYGFYLVATDNAGNSEAAPSGTAPDDSTIVDTGNPTATVTTTVNPIRIGALTQTVKVTYNESMNTGTTPTITLTGSNWATQVLGAWTTTTNTNDTYTTTLTHDGDAEEIVDAVATVATASGATDLAGNSDIGDSSDVFVIDTKAPTVLSVIPTTLADADITSPVSVVIIFSEAMDSTNPTVTISGLTTSYTVSAISSPWSTDKTQWTGTFTFVDQNEVGTGTYNISGAKDAVGNVMAVDNTNQVAVDTENPTATVTVGTPIISDSDLVQEVTVTYNEEMSATPAPTITFSGGTWTAGTGSWDTTTKWIQSFTITDNEEEIASVTVTSLGAKDIAGNVEGANTTAPTFDIDTKNPAKPDANKMTVAMNNTTPNTDDTISGNAGAVEANSIVKVYSDLDSSSNPINFIDSIVALADGSFGAIDIGNNEHAIVYVTATDAAGNESLATSMLNDIEAPTITVALDDVDGYVNAIEASAGINIFITTTGVEDGQIATCEIKDSASTPNVISSLTGAISSNAVTIVSGDLTGLIDGAITATCDVSDVAGNPAVQGSDTSIKDVLAPTVVITAPLSGDKVNGNAVITFTDDELTSPQCSVDNNTWVNCTSGTTKLSDITGFSGLGEGNFTLYLKDTDTAGNTGTDSEAGIIKDTTAPTITNITSDKSNGSYTFGEKIDIDITFSENVTFTGDITVNLNTGGTCVIPQIITAVNTATCDYTVATDENTTDLDATISGTIIDEAGNTMTNFTPPTDKTLAENKDIVIDTTAPVLEKVTAVPTPTNNSAPDYTFSTSEAGTITYDGSCSSLDTDAVAGDNTITFNELDDGTYSDCTITVTDAAGNPSTVAVSEFMVDTTAPVIFNEIPGNKNTTSDTTPAISADFSENGSGVNVSSIIFSFSGNEEYANEYAVKSAMGVVYNQITPLVAKTYKATVTVVDNAGNSATKTWSFIVNPTATTIAVSSDKWNAYADGESEIKITAKIRDEMGNPITSGTVNFVASPIGDLSDSTCNLDENGFATAILTSDEIGNSTVTAYYDASSGPINSSAYVYFAETPKTISVTADPVNVSADGSAESTITATVLDNGAALQGAIVNFTTDLGTLSSPTATTDANGQATVTLTSTNVGWANIEVSYDTGNGTIYSWTYVEFTEYTAPDTTPPTAMQNPNDNDINVPVAVNPTITFSEAMNETTFTTDNIKLRKCNGTITDCTSGNVSDVDISFVSSETSVTIIPAENLSHETHYYLYIGAGVKDLADNPLSPTWTSANRADHEFTTAVDNSICFENDDGTQTCNISLNAGWNLISSPVVVNNTPANVFSEINNNVEIVKYYNSGQWLSYIPNGVDNINVIEDGKGYWIKMTNSGSKLTITGLANPNAIDNNGEPTTPQSYSLNENWNLIGFRSVIDRIANNYVSSYISDAGNYSIWKVKGGGYEPLTLSVDSMTPGSGYWLLKR